MECLVASRLLHRLHFIWTWRIISFKVPDSPLFQTPFFQMQAAMMAQLKSVTWKHPGLFMRSKDPYLQSLGLNIT